MPMSQQRSLHKPKTKHRGSWQIQEAKARFSELIETVLEKGIQKITKSGQEIAVILSLEEFKRYTESKESLLEFFKDSPCQEVDLEIRRNKTQARKVIL